LKPRKRSRKRPIRRRSLKARHLLSGRPAKFNKKSAELRYLKRHIDKLWDIVSESDKVINNLEVHADLVQRLLVCLCLEKLGMRLSELRRYIRKAEKEAIADSEVFELEELFNLPARRPSRKGLAKHRRRKR